METLDDSILFFDRKGNLQKQVEFEGIVTNVLNISKAGDKVIVKEDNIIKRLKLPNFTTEAEYSLNQYDSLVTIGEKMKSGVAVSSKNKKLFTFDLESGKKIKTISLKASFISSIFINSDESLLFVVYQDSKAEVY